MNRGTKTETKMSLIEEDSKQVNEGEERPSAQQAIGEGRINKTWGRGAIWEESRGWKRKKKNPTNRYGRSQGDIG